MKKLLLALNLAVAGFASAQFSSGTVSLGSSGMTVKLDTNTTTVTITVTGSSSSYLGIGFGSSGMVSGSDGFIYNATSNRDYTFNGIGATPSADTSQDWTQTSNTVSGTTRTVVATRTLAGGSGDFAIANAAGTISIYYAIGSSTTISSHTNRGYATLNMAASLGTNDLALESKKTVLYPNPARSTVSFKNADKIKSVDVYETTGKKVKSVKMDQDTINISDLQQGSYYLEINLKDGSTLYEKLIKE